MPNIMSQPFGPVPATGPLSPVSYVKGCLGRSKLAFGLIRKILPLKNQCPRLHSSFPCLVTFVAVTYSAIFPNKPGKRRLCESGQIGQKLNVPTNMSGHYYNKKTKAKSNKKSNYTIYGTGSYELHQSPLEILNL